MPWSWGGSLQQQDGLDIVVTGSSTLTHALIGAGLVLYFRPTS